MTDSTPTNSTSPNQLRDPDFFWLHRWLALKDTIKQTINLTDEDVKVDKETKELFKELLCNLLTFGQKQFLYFFLGFTHNPVNFQNQTLWKETLADFGQQQPRLIKKLLDAFRQQQPGLIKNVLDSFKQQQPKLIKDYDYPPEYVLRTILDQIAVDFEITQRAMHQRQHGTKCEQETLNLADLWGQELVGRVKKMFEFSHGNQKVSLRPKVITYFNRSPLIRMIPYDNVALIGIPLTATRDGHRRDLLVIGHELGHYAYWHGQVKDQSIREILRHIVRGEMPYIKNWIEEIFADVFGFVVSKQMAISLVALDMVADNPSYTHVQDNRVHPIDALRPHIYINTLSALGLDFWEGKKVNEADDVAKSKGGSNRFKTIDGQGREITIKLKDAKNNLQSIIDNLLADTLGQFNSPDWDILETENGERQNSLTDWWVNSRKDRWEEEKENRYTNFEKTLKDIYESSQNVGHKQPPQQKDKGNKELRSFEVIRETNFPEAVQPEIWKIVFAADGWTVKGPETQPVGGWEGEPSGGHNPFH